MKDKLLNIINLNKSFDKDHILKDITFSINKGESIGFLGPSGCGKTTLINIIAGLEKSSFGVIEKKVKSLALVFQEDRLIPWKTLRQNFEFISDDQNIIEKALEISDLKEYQHLYPNQLSGGMRQRANFARIIFNNPELILLDEPFQSLDLKTKDQIIRYFLKLKERFKFSSILVSHDVKEEIMLCDTIYILSKKPSTIVNKIKISKPYSIKTLFDPFILKKEIEIIKMEKLFE